MKIAFTLFLVIFFMFSNAHAFEESWRAECFEDTLLEEKTCYAYVFGETSVPDQIRVYINNKGSWGVFFGNLENNDEFSKTIVKVGQNDIIKLKSNFIAGAKGQTILKQFLGNESSHVRVRIYGSPETRNYSVPMNDFKKSYIKIKQTLNFDPLSINYRSQQKIDTKLRNQYDEILKLQIKILNDLLNNLKKQDDFVKK